MKHLLSSLTRPLCSESNFQHRKSRPELSPLLWWLHSSYALDFAAQMVSDLMAWAVCISCIISSLRDLKTHSPKYELPLINANGAKNLWLSGNACLRTKSTTTDVPTIGSDTSWHSRWPLIVRTTCTNWLSRSLIRTLVWQRDWLFMKCWHRDSRSGRSIATWVGAARTSLSERREGREEAYQSHLWRCWALLEEEDPPFISGEIRLGKVSWVSCFNLHLASR